MRIEVAGEIYIETRNLSKKKNLKNPQNMQIIVAWHHLQKTTHHNLLSLANWSTMKVLTIISKGRRVVLKTINQGVSVLKVCRNTSKDSTLINRDQRRRQNSLSRSLKTSRDMQVRIQPQILKWMGSRLWVKSPSKEWRECSGVSIGKARTSAK